MIKVIPTTENICQSCGSMREVMFIGHDDLMHKGAVCGINICKSCRKELVDELMDVVVR